MLRSSRLNVRLTCRSTYIHINHMLSTLCAKLCRMHAGCSSARSKPTNQRFCRRHCNPSGNHTRPFTASRGLAPYLTASYLCIVSTASLHTGTGRRIVQQPTPTATPRCHTLLLGHTVPYVLGCVTMLRPLRRMSMYQDAWTTTRTLKGSDSVLRTMHLYCAVRVFVRKWMLSGPRFPKTTSRMRACIPACHSILIRHACYSVR